jgi:geranylgeranyl diphosphate synthase, type II
VINIFETINLKKMIAEKTSINKMLEQYFKEQVFKCEPRELYEPVNYIMQSEGKRIRPLLALMSCEMFDGNAEDALAPAYALELFHNFTLVHDDIMDNAELRRGLPSVHKKFGVNTAILSGDVMLSFVYQYLNETSAEKFAALFPVFNENLIKVFEGQQLDMNFEKRTDVSETEYLKMIEYKTSALIAAALQAGAVMADASEKNRELIYQFGLNLGLSFQIKDDYLDAFGNAEQVGKKVGGDILQNKKTYLLVSALNAANTIQRNEIIALLNEKDETKKIEAMLQLFDDLKIKSKAVYIMQEFYDIALDAMKAIDVPAEMKKPLLLLASQIHQREF